jgi:hypothetical protein
VRRIDLEHALNLGARIVPLGVVEIELRQQQVRIGELLVDSGSALIASSRERRASGLLYFSRNSSPHAASTAGSADAPSAAR